VGRGTQEGWEGAHSRGGEGTQQGWGGAHSRGGEGHTAGVGGALSRVGEWQSVENGTGKRMCALVVPPLLCSGLRPLLLVHPLAPRQVMP